MNLEQSGPLTLKADLDYVSERRVLELNVFPLFVFNFLLILFILLRLISLFFDFSFGLIM